jgi:hypothetical protein
MFTVYAPPTISTAALMPNSGPLTGGSTFTVSGGGFVSTQTIRLRIAGHSLTYATTVNLPASALSTEVVALCKVLTTTTASCVSAANTYPELVIFSLTMDDPTANMMLLFTSTTVGPEYLYYRPPTSQPSLPPPTSQPSFKPTLQPSSKPTIKPTSQPSSKPSSFPTTRPTVYGSIIISVSFQVTLII